MTGGIENIVIIGAGAMGSIFGALLSKVAGVTLIDPFDAHVETINKNGLSIEDTEGKTSVYKISAMTKPDNSVSDADMAIIFTKSGFTEDAAFMAKPVLKPDGLALTLQNGLGNLEIMQKILGKKRCFAGVTSHGGTLLGPGKVRHAGKGPTYIGGDPSPDESPARAAADVFNAAGIKTTLSRNLDSLIWGKLIINIGINALAAICAVPNGVLGKTPECRKIMKEAVNEACEIAKACNISLPYENPMEVVIEVCEKTGKNRASMLQDIMRGVKTEIGVINRAIVNKGKEMNIPTPCNLFLSQIIEALEATSESRIL